MNEVGDLLFACVNVSRLLEVDEEEALNKSINKFIKDLLLLKKNFQKQEKT